VAKLLTCLLGAVLAAAFAPASRADNYPQGLMEEQLQQAARGIEVDLAALKPGEIASVEYVGRPVLVYKRTRADAAYLKKPAKDLADPEGQQMQASLDAVYASSASLTWARLLLVDQPALEKTPGRSRRDEVLVVAGWTPASGCQLGFRRTRSKERPDVVFTDSCGKGNFDAAGRVFTETPQPGKTYNLYIPPHRFTEDNKVVIGLAPGVDFPQVAFSHTKLYRGSDPTYDLIIAARYDDARMVDIALAKGADVNGFREQEGSPLDGAIVGSRIETVKLLLARGARPSGRSMRAAEVIGRKEVWEMLEAMARTKGSR
jgi:ubiquinol-cytochrome c reductase iron-sulfur subunit